MVRIVVFNRFSLFDGFDRTLVGVLVGIGHGRCLSQDICYTLQTILDTRGLFIVLSTEKHLSNIKDIQSFTARARLRMRLSDTPRLYRCFERMGGVVRVELFGEFIGPSE